jgi:hypothetical protein
VTVDDADYVELSRYSWCLRVGTTGIRYAQRMTPRDSEGRQTTVLMHRQVMGFPEAKVDHINGDGLDNRRENLRAASDSLNGWNRRGADRDNATGCRGVTRARGRFRAHATVKGRYHHLGIYDTAEKAAQVAADFRATVPDLALL